MLWLLGRNSLLALLLSPWVAPSCRPDHIDSDGDANGDTAADTGSDTGDDVDADCDAASDAACPCTPGETQPCGSDVGECARGSVTCGMEGTWGDTCIGEVDPQPEECDGVDNDCNGDIDDDAAGTGVPCNSDVGACTGGVMVCHDGLLVCEADVEPVPELCDGVDNDCDGDIDEAGDNPSCVDVGDWSCEESGCHWSFPNDHSDAYFAGFVTVRESGMRCSRSNDDAIKIMYRAPSGGGAILASGDHVATFRVRRFGDPCTGSSVGLTLQVVDLTAGGAVLGSQEVRRSNLPEGEGVSFTIGFTLDALAAGHGIQLRVIRERCGDVDFCIVWTTLDHLLPPRT